MNKRLSIHPVLDVVEQEQIKFFWEDKELFANKNEILSSALFANGIKIFGHHHKDNSAQGIFCANNQCSKCMVIVDEVPKKSCMVEVYENMRVKPAEGLPELPFNDIIPNFTELETIKTDVLIIGGGPSGLSAALELDKNNIKTILIDDKNILGGKLVLQTHKFFGSVEDSFAGSRGNDIGKNLAGKLFSSKNIDIWLESTALYVFNDKKVGILRTQNKEQEYVLVEPKILLNAAGAREKFLKFSGNALAGIYGAGAFQTLVNRDLVKAANRLFIIGVGNVGLIAGYHALQAGINVVGLCEAMPNCGGYKVHADKLKRLGVPIYTSHTIVSANGTDNTVSSITIAQIDNKFNILEGSFKTFECDTILIAVGLESLKEFTQTAESAGMKVYATGDANEIAEASSAMFNGKIIGVKISKELGANIDDIPQEWFEKAEILKSHPGKICSYTDNNLEEGVFPVIHCLQEIPCNPCTTVCPTNSIKINSNSIMPQPEYCGSCVGCGKCLLICPGLAISIVDYRKDKDNPIITLPFEVGNYPVVAGDDVELSDIDANILGKFKVISVIFNKEYKTQQVKIQVEKSIAKKAISFKIQEDDITKPSSLNTSISKESDDIYVCLCERVKVSEVRDLIKKGVTDINQIKAVTRLGMGACGSKTCDIIIRQIFKEEGNKPEEIVAHTRRPLFVETPIHLFAHNQSDINVNQQTTNIEKNSIISVNNQKDIEHFEIIVIGAGSIGVPTTLALAKTEKKVLCIDSQASCGQENNKKAIGGVRATHSDFGKINVCKRSIEIFSTWKEIYGDDIGWISNG
jgi:heterodisulfide reductase subunit A-like polyferredoxin